MPLFTFWILPDLNRVLTDHLILHDKAWRIQRSKALIFHVVLRSGSEMHVTQTSTALLVRPLLIKARQECSLLGFQDGTSVTANGL